jgi:hypothetical protein
VTTQLKFSALDLTKSDYQNPIDLYKTNKKLCTIIVLGQGKSKSQGMALLSKTKSDNSCNRLAWELMNKAKKANKSSDASTVIELEVELD